MMMMMMMTVLVMMLRHDGGVVVVPAPFLMVHHGIGLITGTYHASPVYHHTSVHSLTQEEEDGSYS